MTLGLASAVPLSCDGESVHATFALQEGEEAVFVLRPLKAGEECRRAPSNTETRRSSNARSISGIAGSQMHLYRPLARNGVSIGADAQTDDLRADRSDYRLADLQPARVDRRRTELGLSLHLDSRLRLYAVWPVENRLHGGSARFMKWLEARAGEVEAAGTLQIVYGIDGRHNLKEQTLDHLEGYRGSRPVRIGNGAYAQLQLDIFGELLDSLYLYNKHVMPISYDVWIRLRHGLDWLCDNWQQPDEGIWEVRGGRRHFVYSKLMCWVAMDRGIRLADKRSFPADRDRWQRVRDQIYEEIMSKGWSQKRQAFVQHYDGDSLDASNLIMPMVFFMAPNDPRMLSTLHAINRSPKEGGLVSDGLVYRYDSETGEDGLKGGEGTFTMCSFWLVEALTRAGRVDRAKLTEARLLFERMLGHANHLGLYAEEIGGSGEALGNFPQAFTHFALISAAFNLDRALDGKPHS